MVCGTACHAQTIFTTAGNGTATFGGDGFSAALAQINDPRGVTFDATGNMYISDAGNHRIRKVTPGGVISTFAGTGVPGMSGDGGPATAAELNAPWGIAADNAGNIYYADIYAARVRKISPSGIITTFAGTGIIGYSGDGGPATAATIGDVSGVTADLAGNVYITSPGNNCVRKVNPAGIITTIAGTGTLGYSSDGGPATAAQLNTPHAVTIDALGNIYIADQYNQRVRKINTSGIISTIAGTGTGGFSGDGGPATAAEVLNPTSVAVDGTGNIYIASYNAHVIRKIDGAGVISTLGGVAFSAGYNGDGGSADTSQLNHPYAITLGPDGGLYIADQLNNRIREITTVACTNADAGVIISSNGSAFCSNDSSILALTAVNSGTGYSYQWQSSTDGATWTNVGYNHPGYQTGSVGSEVINYRAIVTCGPASISDTSATYVITPVNTVSPSITVTLNPGTTISPGTTVTFTAAVINGGTTPTLQWYKNGLPIVGATTNPFITNALADNDTITCLVHSNAVCAAPDSVESAKIVMSVNTSVADAHTDLSARLYPNPTGGSIHLSGKVPVTGQLSVQVENILGQKVYSADLNGGNGILNLELMLPGNCTNGVYIVKLSCGSSTWLSRFLLER